ncbi:type II toxin-antitoxin system TacA family antitoxin [Pseudoxanthomonas mexicana]
MSATASARSARLGLRATPEQETVLRRAAEVAHKSLTDFVLDAAYRAAEQTLLDQRLFMVSGSQYQALLDMMDRPESENPGLADLFSRRPAWAGE